MSPLVLHFISNVATPHVNPLLAELAARPEVRLHLWYAADSSPLYGWKQNPTHAVQPARILGRRLPSLPLIARALYNPQERLLLVGWSNPTTRLLIPLLAAAGRRFGFFTDHPREEQDRSAVRRLLRESYFSLLRRRATVFAVGRRTVDYFVQRRGFPADRVHNLPMPVVPIARPVGIRDAVRTRLGVTEPLFLVAGSRLVPEKGFDLLLQALASLGPDERGRVRLLLIGNGPEEVPLRSLADRLGIIDQVIFERWLDPEELESCVHAADVVVHPARFDAYGGISMLALGAGRPLIGSTQAGSAIELVEHGRNGFLYQPEDVAALANHVRFFLENPDAVQRMGAQSAAMAARWSARMLAERLIARLQMEPTR